MTTPPTHLTAYYVSFGPHGPRTPVNPPGTGIKVFAGTLGAVALALGLFGLARARGEYKHGGLKKWQCHFRRVLV